MKVVVGLGNPGPKYAGTRHNVGFDVVDYLSHDPRCGPFRAKFQSQVAEWAVGAEPVLLVKPETFMNLSGRAVRQVLDFYKLTPADVLIVSDDFSLPLGKLRARAKGSHGGQNGLRDIQQQLGTDEYPRLRLGVGQPGPGEAVDFVLSRFKPGDRAVVADAIAQAGAAVVVWVTRGLEACMNQANGPDPAAAKPKKPRPAAKGESESKGEPVPPPSVGGGPRGGDTHAEP